MADGAIIEEDLRNKIISHPDVILEDVDLMRALVERTEQALGDNVVDLRGIAMQRLMARLDRLEDTHRSVIAAAYDNLSGTDQIHRAVLQMLDAVDFETFLQDLKVKVAPILRVDALRLVLETEHHATGEADLRRLSDVLSLVRPGYVAEVLTGGRNIPERRIMLRSCKGGGTPLIFGAEAVYLGSEACLRLDLGAGRLPGLLALGSVDPHQFAPTHGTDLLSFFASAFERAMRRWLG